MTEEQDFRIVDPAAPAAELTIITNATDPATGALLCPECGHGSVWGSKETGFRTAGPMQKMVIPGKVDALVHRCCGQNLIRKVYATPAAKKGE